MEEIKSTADYALSTLTVLPMASASHSPGATPALLPTGIAGIGADQAMLLISPAALYASIGSVITRRCLGSGRGELRRAFGAVMLRADRLEGDRSHMSS